MDWFRAHLFMFSMVFWFSAVSSNELGSTCSQDRECQVRNSHCVSGICTCKHYYARLNSTACLESRLLGRECLIDEQCSLRVANSTCKNEFCHCSEGFIRFRKHTCLGPAKPGSVCYSDEHCQMWSKSTYCKFIIPNLFGKCACLHEGNCESEHSTKSPEKNPPKEETDTIDRTETAVTASESSEDEKHIKPNEEADENTWNVKNPSMTDPPFADPFSYQKEHLQDPAIDDQSSHDDTNDTNGNKNIGELDTSTLTEVEVAETTSGIEIPENYPTTSESVNGSNLNESKYRVETNTNETLENIWRPTEPISLGFPCQFDSQCQKEDNESRCIEGICDCVVKDNENKCDKENTGCHPETFQCRSSGMCISWFFVCDGREDCPDGSDEECRGPVCPRSAFQCGVNGICISRAVLCDGIKNCPNGEDENFCLPEHRNVTKECPENTFQCGNGRCLPKYEFCNAIPKCDDGTDESLDLCKSSTFDTYFESNPNTKSKKYCPFKCGNGRCRSTAIICSGRDGCGDNSDEAHCTVCRCPKISRFE